MSFDKYKGYIGLAVILTVLVAVVIVISYKNYKETVGSAPPPKKKAEIVAEKPDVKPEVTPEKTPKETTPEPIKEKATVKPKETTADKELEKYAAELAGAKKLEEEKDLPGAKKEYESLLPSFENPELLQKEIYRLNIALLFSPQVTAPPDGPKSEIYSVKAGDTVEGIAKKFNTTPDLIMGSNGIKDPKTIQIGNRYKVITDEFSIIISRSKNILTLLAGDMVLKEYPVGTGQYDKTPLGDFKIRNRMTEPVWNGIKYGDPRNVLGTRWMGLVNEGDTIPGYGIHGTWEPASVGKSVSQGCIRMFNEDVEELFKIVPVGTKVKIIE